MADTKRWPRVRLVLPTSCGHTFESLAQWAFQRFTIQPPRCTVASLSVDPGGQWLGPDVASTGTAGGVTGNATGTRRERWYAREVSVC